MKVKLSENRNEKLLSEKDDPKNGPACESLLKSKDDDDDEKGEPLLNHFKKQSEEPLGSIKDLLARFYTHLGRNGGTIYYIDSYLVKDKADDLKKMKREELISVESLRGYSLEDILVTETNAADKKGYVRINNKVDIPLADLEPGVSPKYFFDEKEALRELKRLQEIELNLSREIAKVADAAISYIKRTIERNQH